MNIIKQQLICKVLDERQIKINQQLIDESLKELGEHFISVSAELLDLWVKQKWFLLARYN